MDHEVLVKERGSDNPGRLSWELRIKAAYHWAKSTGPDFQFQSRENLPGVADLESTPIRLTGQGTSLVRHLHE